MKIPFSEASNIPVARPYCHSIKGKNFNVITLGTCSYVGNVSVDYEDYGKYIIPNVLIGNFCSLASNITFFMGYNHEYKNTVTTFPFDALDVMKRICSFANIDKLNYFPREKRYDNHYQNIVGNDVWIGRGVLIMGGVKIGSGAIIGTNSVVAKDIPPYAIAAGNPARVVKYRFDAETVKKLMAIKWWNWDIKKILDNVPIMGDIEKFLAENYKPALERIPYAKIGGGGRLSNNIAQKAEKFIRSLQIFAQFSRSGKELSAAF